MKRVLAAALLGGVLGLAGCTPADKAEIREDVQGIRQEAQEAARGAQAAAEQAALEGKVKSALLTRKGLDARQINVDAEGSRIVLKGEVPTREQADLAERVTGETRGVTEVDNQLRLAIPAETAAPSAETGPATEAMPPAPAPAPVEPAPEGYRKTN